MENKKFYRYELQFYSSMYDLELGNYSTSYVNSKLVCREFVMRKETPKGYWIGYGSIDTLHSMWRKWIPKESTKRYAYPTKEEALNNYIARTKKRKKILQNQLDGCTWGLNLANKELNKL
jgi:hypothetical protein